MHCHSTGRFVRLLQRRCFLPLHLCRHRRHCCPSWAIGAVPPRSVTSSRRTCRERCPAAQRPDDGKVQGVKKRADAAMRFLGQPLPFTVTIPETRPGSPRQPALTALTRCEAQGFELGKLRVLSVSPGLGPAMLFISRVYSLGATKCRLSGNKPRVSVFRITRAAGLWVVFEQARCNYGLSVIWVSFFAKHEGPSIKSRQTIRRRPATQRLTTP